MAQGGYVAVHEAGAETRHMKAFEALEAEGRLPVRVYAMLSARDEELCRALAGAGPRRHQRAPAGHALREGLLRRRARLARARACSPTTRTGPATAGVSGDGYGFDQKIVADMMRAGFQVGVHAIGDAGNRETLDFIASVTAGSARRPRRCATASSTRRCCIPTTSPGSRRWASSPPWSRRTARRTRPGPRPGSGPSASRAPMPGARLRRAGARLALNSDLPGSDHDIFYGLHAAITRRDKQLEPREGWYPGERLTPEEAVRGYTTWNAYAAFQENETGMLAAGRWADITVMDVDPVRPRDHRARPAPRGPDRGHHRGGAGGPRDRGLRERPAHDETDERKKSRTGRTKKATNEEE